MTNSTYMNARKQYARPQAILFSEDSGELSGGSYVPSGYEIGNSLNDTGSFIILSDHSRGPLDFGVQRIENRQRMVNGRMRSYFIADKRTLSVSWDMLPSMSFIAEPKLYTTTCLQTIVVSEFTVDGGAGGAELLDWYEKHYGTFYVFLAYDKFPEFGRDNAAYTHLAQYQEVLEMYITDFTWSVQKRGGSNFDMWNISITLEEA